MGVNMMNTSQPTYDDILVLMKELFVSQKDTDRMFQDTDRKFQDIVIQKSSVRPAHAYA